MRRNKGRNGLLPSSLRIISSCLKTVSTNATNVASTVRSAGASVAASISVPHEDEKDQVLWVGFDKLELSPDSFKHVLLIGYANGFHVVDVEDASNVCELVSRRDGPVTFLQLQPIPIKSEYEGFRASHPLLLVVAGDETNGSGIVQGGRLSALIREGSNEPQQGDCTTFPTVVRLYSLKSHSYVHYLRFRSPVYLVRCSPRMVAVGLAAQIYCFDAVTLENKFSVLTYPLQGTPGVNIGYGPMAIGPRWMAYASNNPLLSNTGRLSPQNLTPSPGVSPSTSPGNGSLVARYAMESSKQLAAGILNLGDMGYKTLSKYYQEFVPDGSYSPLSSNSVRRTGRNPSSAHPNEADNAGMVMIKDFVSKEDISHFRAHNSPISALCFDPSGTLLVTASVNGHNINVFRIMPTFMTSGSNKTCYDWTSSHVHLYKLYRGLTSAVIQDICFSQFSQWIAIVSSRGTCHIFLLSPFGGDVSLQQQSPDFGKEALVPNLSMPWWSSSSCITDEQSLLPPPSTTLSVVSRIKNCSSGWINTVSNAAASATGKIAKPSGAIAAVFHNSMSHPSPPFHVHHKSLEYLLTYSPSGHLIQHELLPSSGAESSDSSSKSGSGSLVHFQDEELHVNAEPVQWWDVCRRSNWPERDQSIPKILSDSQQKVVAVINTADCHGLADACSMSCTNGNETLKSHERPHWYLSNAEVQLCSGRIPIWQKTKICFYVMILSSISEQTAAVSTGGEMEVEKLLCHEVEIRRKDLLPVFKSSHLVCWDSGSIGKRCQTSTSVTHLLDTDKLTKDSSGGGDSKTAFFQPGSDAVSKSASSSTTESLHKLDGNANEEASIAAKRKLIPRSFQCDMLDESTAFSPTSSQMDSPGETSKFPVMDCVFSDVKHAHVDNPIAIGLTSSASTLECAAGTVVADNFDSNNSIKSEFSNDQSNTTASASDNSVEFTRFFHEGYCNVSQLDDCCELTEAVADSDSISSHCEREKEGGDNDDFLGGVFAYSDEG